MLFRSQLCDNLRNSSGFLQLHAIRKYLFSFPIRAKLSYRLNCVLNEYSIDFACQYQYNNHTHARSENCFVEIPRLLKTNQHDSKIPFERECVTYSIREKKKTPSSCMGIDLDLIADCHAMPLFSLAHNGYVVNHTDPITSQSSQCAKTRKMNFNLLWFVISLGGR